MTRVAAAGFIGALMEWYDFYIFANASALIFGRLFFPGHDPVVSTMEAFGAFAAGFLARPLGGLLFGHIGDKIGRKASLVATLLIIGIGTFLIGLLPTYQTAGVTAPILLIVLRVIQGIGLGGEYGGASLIIIEHAPKHRRGFWGSLPQAASPGGLLLATVVFSLVSLLPDHQFSMWGWRVPFLLSIVMLGIGMYIRLSVEEPPEFLRARAAAPESAAAPAMELARTHKGDLLLAVGARMAETVCGNFVKSFGLAYVTVHLMLSRDIALSALLATSAVGLVVTPLFGLLGDAIGRRNTYMLGAALAALLAVPMFWLLDFRTAAATWIAFIVYYNLGPTLMLSVQATFFAEMFRTRVRYTALSMAYQLSSVIGGFTPIMAIALLKTEGGRPWLLGGALVLVALLSFICSLIARPAPPRLAARSIDTTQKA
jgi:MHS family shikimate/dehydroshikimate transporter-like MFS transporter